MWLSRHSESSFQQIQTLHIQIPEFQEYMAWFHTYYIHIHVIYIYHNFRTIKEMSVCFFFNLVPFPFRTIKGCLQDFHFLIPYVLHQHPLYPKLEIDSSIKNHVTELVAAMMSFWHQEDGSQGFQGAGGGGGVGNIGGTAEKIVFLSIPTLFPPDRATRAATRPALPASVGSV